VTTKNRRDVAPQDAEDVTVTDDELDIPPTDNVDDVPPTDDASDDASDDESKIVSYQQVTDPATGQATVVTHGPMPVSEWAAYEREHNL
jgi:hypothetical protein